MYDLPQTPDIIVAAGTLLAGVAACAGALIAFSGLNSWKRQSVWARDTDLAKRLVVSIRKRQDAFKWLRNGFYSAGELSNALFEVRKSNPDAEEKNSSSFAAQLRLDKLYDARELSYGDVLEASALWGDRIEKLVSDLDEIERKVVIAQQSNFSGTFSGNTPEMVNADSRNRMIAYSFGEDEIGAKYDGSVEEIKKYLSEKIGR
jgi:hypothetical protein